MRAGVTESEFREIFPTFEECYQAAFEQGVGQLARTLAQATGRGQGWLERVRAGLVALLGFFDDEPGWAGLLVMDAPCAGRRTIDCRQSLTKLLADLLDSDRRLGALYAQEDSSPVLPHALTGELIAGGVLSVIRTSMLEQGSAKLVELAPSLMAFIVAPYLGQAAAQAELCGNASARSAHAESGSADVRAQAISRAAGLPVRATHRTTMVLRAIARAPCSNNREVARAAELSDEGQTSKLLARLERQGVIANVGVGAARGEPNAWLLTPSGTRTLELLEQSPDPSLPRRRRTGSRWMA